MVRALSDIVNEVSTLQSIEIGGNSHPIEYFMGGDMKFLAMVCGIEAANATFSCVWCKCPATDRWDMTREWAAFDTSKGARTIQEIEVNRKSGPRQSELVAVIVQFSGLFQLTTSS